MQKLQLPSNKPAIQNPQLKVRSQSVYPVKKVVNVNLDNLPSPLQVVEKVGQGSFGEIYKLYNTKLKILQACKVEFKDRSSNPQQQQLLPKEYSVMQTLVDQQTSQYQFIQTNECNMIIMPYYGFGNLEELRKKNKDGKFSKKTILLIGKAILDSIEQLHSKRFLHRDIKPENFIVGSIGDHHKVYMIDYGLAKQYQDENGVHVSMTQNRGMVGTARYTSINSHRGLEQSRRDDLEAIGYVLLYLYLGQVPWQNFVIPCQTRQEKFQKICEEKVKFQSNMIDVDCPIQLRKFFDYVKTLQFDQKPDYQFLKSLFIIKNYDSNDRSKLRKNHIVSIGAQITECDIVSNEVPINKKTNDKRQNLQSGTTEITTDKKNIEISRHQQFQNIVENDVEQSNQQYEPLVIPEDEIKINKIIGQTFNKRTKQ